MEAEGSGQDRGEPPGSFNAQNVTGSPSVLRRAGGFLSSISSAAAAAVAKISSPSITVQQ